MDIICTNPFRVIGLYGSASEREIQKQKSKINAYLNIGKELLFDTDFNFLPPLNRNAETIEKAFSRIQLNQNKLFYALFWFSIGSHFDELAINFLKEGDCEKALYVWRQIAENSEQSQKYSISNNNLSTLEIAMACQSEIDLDLLIQALQSKLNFIQSDSFSEYKIAIIDDIYVPDQTELIGLLFDELFEYFLSLKKDGIFTSKKIFFCIEQILNTVNYKSRQPLRQKVISELTSAIEGEITNTKLKRKSYAKDGLIYGNKLIKSIENNWQILNKHYSDDYAFEAIGEKLSIEILECAIDNFNDFTKYGDKNFQKESEIKFGRSVLTLMKSAKEYSDAYTVIQRIDENIKTISDWIYSGSKVDVHQVSQELIILSRKIKQLDEKSEISKIEDKKPFTSLHGQNMFRLFDIIKCWEECKAELISIQSKLEKENQTAININSWIIHKIMIHLIDETNSLNIGLKAGAKKIDFQHHFLSFLEEALEFSITDDLSESIKENISIIKSNLKTPEKSKINRLTFAVIFLVTYAVIINAMCCSSYC